MTLPETAFAFCRECLSWDVGSSILVFPNSAQREVVSDRATNRTFDYRDLNAVITAMQDWMDGYEDFGLVVHHSRRGTWHAAIVNESIFPPDLKGESEETCVDPCVAIMQACLEAARKLKEKAA